KLLFTKCVSELINDTTIDGILDILLVVSHHNYHIIKFFAETLEDLKLTIPLKSFHQFLISHDAQYKDDTLVLIDRLRDPPTVETLRISCMGFSDLTDKLLKLNIQ